MNTIRNIKNRMLRLSRMWAIAYNMAFKSLWQYKGKLLVWTVVAFLQPVLSLILISASTKAGVLSYGTDQIMTYFVLLFFVSQILFNTTLAVFGKEIISGEFSKYLLRPVGYELEASATTIASIVVKWLVVIIPFVVMLLLFSNQLSISVNIISVVYFLLSLVVAILLVQIVHRIVLSLVFFVKKTVGFYNFLDNVISLFSGLFIPLFIMPKPLFDKVQYLPFRYMLSFPLEILIGFQNDCGVILRNLFIGIVWLIILTIIYKFLWKKGITKYEGYGI